PSIAFRLMTSEKLLASLPLSGSVDDPPPPQAASAAPARTSAATPPAPRRWEKPTVTSFLSVTVTVTQDRDHVKTRSHYGFFKIICGPWSKIVADRSQGHGSMRVVSRVRGRRPRVREARSRVRRRLSRVHELGAARREDLHGLGGDGTGSDREHGVVDGAD